MIQVLLKYTNELVLLIKKGFLEQCSIIMIFLYINLFNKGSSKTLYILQ